MKQPKDFFLPVEKMPMADVLPGYGFNSGITHLIVTQTPEGPKVVNSCSKNYTIIRNEDIFKPLEEKMTEAFDIEIKGSQLNYSKFYMDFMIKDKAFPILAKDSIIPQIRVMNSYDGSLKYSFKLMFLRLVCTNGMTVPMSDAKGAHIKMMHTPSAIGKWEKVVDIAHDFLSKAKDMLGGYKELASNKLTLEEAILRIEEVLKHTKAPSKAKERMVDKLQQEHKMGLPYSDWLVYNAVNYELNHGEGKSPLHKKDKVDQQVLNYLLP